ncbi:MAG: NADP-dependent oxidoreductase [Chloroflexota bacterium]|nr:NADP-dependent oxidoreductase [Chloroflexota bacterium]
MDAFVMRDFDAPPTVAAVPTPQAGPGEVLVRVRAASVNGFDLGVVAGMFRGMMEYPFPVVLGRDFAGTVEAVGEGAARFAAGDAVFGAVADPSTLFSRSFAEYVVVPEAPHLARIPAGVDVVQAGALGVAGAAALQAVEAVAPHSGETVLVSGATGGVGAYAVQLAAARGATVIATAKAGAAADFVGGLGAAYTGDLAAQVRAIAPEGVDAVIHAAGDVTELGALLAPHGRLASTLLMSPHQAGPEGVPVTAVMANPDVTTLDRLAAEVAADRLRVPIQRTYPLDQAGQAFADFSGALGKVVIEMA